MLNFHTLKCEYRLFFVFFFVVSLCRFIFASFHFVVVLFELQIMEFLQIGMASLKGSFQTTIFGVKVMGLCAVSNVHLKQHRPTQTASSVQVYLMKQENRQLTEFKLERRNLIQPNTQYAMISHLGIVAHSDKNTTQ